MTLFRSLKKELETQYAHWRSIFLFDNSANSVIRQIYKHVILFLNSEISSTECACEYWCVENQAQRPNFMSIEEKQEDSYFHRF